MINQSINHFCRRQCWFIFNHFDVIGPKSYWIRK